MVHGTALIATIAMAFVLSFAFGFIAARLRLPPLVGYLLAGVAVGPFTPGFVGDIELAAQLAEIGVILLMFGVGLHFSIRDLLAVRSIAVPGAIAQIATATLIGAAVAHAWGWGFGAGVVFGLSLSVASTVVLLRALEQRNALDRPEGRIAVGWLIVEDLATVLALVLLPALAEHLGTGSGAPGDASGSRGIGLDLALTLGKVTAFIALALIVGIRVVPWLLAQVARTGSRELFTLAVLATALGIAYGSAELFDVSFALGAFFAGVILSESELSQKAGADSLPLQDAFAVLFFVSVGMLFDPSIVVREPLALLAVLAIVLVGKSLAAFLIMVAFRHPLRAALTVSASLAQIGEFSFILAGLGVTLGLMPAEGRDLVLAGALLSITLNPLAFAGIEPILASLRGSRLLRSVTRAESTPGHPGLRPAPAWPLENHVILVGFGRVGSSIGRALWQAKLPCVVVEREPRLVQCAREHDMPAILGDGSAAGVLDAAGVGRARLLVIAIPDGFHARSVLERARAANPAIDTAVRTHSEEELGRLEALGVGCAVMGERALALGIVEYALRRFAVDADGGPR